MKFGGRAYLITRERRDNEKLYAVNPNVPEIDSEKTYARIQDIHDEIDHAIVTVPAPFVVQAIADCAEKEVRVVQILTAGFSETGSPEGVLWEKQIRDIAEQNGMRNEMIDLIIGFKAMPDFKGKRVSVMGGGGAITVAAADALEKEDMSILPFSDETQEAIRAHLPPHGNSVKNPVDVGSPRFLPKTFRPILEALAESDRVDAIIVEQLVFIFGGYFDEKLAEVIPSARASSGKPFIVTLPQSSIASNAMELEETRRKYRDWYLARSIPVFDSLQQAANVLGKIIRYNEFIVKRKS